MLTPRQHAVYRPLVREALKTLTEEVRMNINRFRDGFNVAIQWVVGWLRRIFRRRIVTSVGIALDGVETTVIARVRRDGVIEVLEVLATKGGQRC